MIQKIEKIFRKYREFGGEKFVRVCMEQFAYWYWSTKPVWTPRKIYIPLSEVNIKTPVFVLGVQGGGLTLLSRMINRNQNFVSIGGGNEFWAGKDEMDKFYPGYSKLPDEFALRTPVSDTLTGQEKSHPVFGLYRSGIYAIDDLFSAFRKTKEDYTQKIEYQFKRFIKRSIRAYSTSGKEARFIDKSQSYTLKIPLLRECFSEVQFVLLVRNPYVMALRELFRRRRRDFKRCRSIPAEKDLLEYAAQHWRNSIQVALRDLSGKDDGIVLRFEDLLRSPENTLKRVTNHINEEFYKDMIPQSHHRLPFGSRAKKKWYPIREDVNNKYFEHLTKDQVKTIEREVQGLDEKFNYEPFGSS